MLLRAVLHQLRDRLTLHEAVGLSAQLPMLIRGIYFEGYRPTHVPEKIRSKANFLEGVAARLQLHRISPELAVQAVFATLAYRCGPDEIADVIDQLPAELKTLWPKDSIRSQ
jgi:uncharacterized protein (DUF2267 family)